MTVSSKKGENFKVLSREHLPHFTSPHFSNETDPITAIASKASTTNSHLLTKSRVAAKLEVWQKWLVSPNSHAFFLS